MTELAQLINLKLSVLTLAGDITVGIYVFMLVLFRKGKYTKQLIGILGRHGLGVAFLISLIATTSSLFYSEIAGYAPCTLCWYQRIFIYPQVLLLGFALWKKDRTIADYSILLSGVGAFIAIYHYYIQLGGSLLTPCSAVGYSVSCSQRFVLQFGYITIPMMSLTAFSLIILCMVSVKLLKRVK